MPAVLAAFASLRAAAAIASGDSSFPCSHRLKPSSSQQNPLLNFEFSLWMGGSLVDSSAEGVSSSLCLCHSTCENAGFKHSSCACSGDGNFEAGIDFGQDDLAVDEIGMAIAEVMHVCSGDDDDDEGTDSGEDSDENEDPLSLESDSTNDVVDIDTELVTSPTFPNCNAAESSINKSDYANSSADVTLLLVSAMKGSRAKRGITTRLSVSWAPDVYDPPVTSGGTGSSDIAVPQCSKLSPLVPSETTAYRDVYSSSSGSRTDIATPQHSKLSVLAPSESASLAGTVPVLKTLEPIKRSSSCCKEPLSILNHPRQFVAAKYKGMFSLWNHNQLAS
uniref:EGF-like domain-containing protein n=1 Tax=Leersia perrieri TaxID=77586 RepID=A0A0D9V726_9ORYZ